MLAPIFWIAAVRRHGARAVAIAFSPLRRSELYVALADGSIECVDTATRAVVGSLKGHLHADSGFPIFKFPGSSARNHVLLSKEASHKLPPLMPHTKMREALNLRAERGTMPPPPTPPRNR